ncbi:RagB/SusD family nutrient uptake outer membrane protein [Pontibacter liquoris]|uniref:RagB/SusD family nutrient uptake outer membrane protein n=1 Tax=Pontibacter liquoris TaxID=2905677 RepID=UPI001FA6B2A6|nr:RagB/SusD family nutrient uptake outer membrane protein [Pontibacter liquoris]
MNKMKYKGYLACLAFLSFLTGCDKEFLERPPKDRIVDANYYQTAEQVLASTTPLYNVVWFAYNDKASHGIGDARGGLLYSGSYQAENIRMNTTGITGENGSAWRAFYNVVGQANTAITNINRYAPASVPEGVKQYAIGEGRFMRGLAYSYLVQNWDAVPIIANNETVLTDTTIARNTVESVWEFIIRDIRFAAKVLPNASVATGRLNKWAAEGMLAKMFLTRAGVGQNGTRNQTDLDSAAYYAKRVIDNSGASLMPNYADLFKTANNNNQESLFALQWKYDGDWGTQNSVQAFLAYGSSLTGFGDGWGGDIGASLFALNQYEDLNQDKRRKATYMLPGDNYDYIHEIVDEKIVPLHVRTDNNNQADYRSRASVKKYVVGLPSDNAGKVTQQHTEINTYMLRLADVYLIYAEAVLGNNASTSDALALQYFNAVRARAGLDPKSSITWEDIHRERLVEFAMEGQAWYEFTRLHYYKPQLAYDLLSSQDRGLFWAYPNDKANATSWDLVPQSTAISRTVTVNSGNFFLPLPATELSRAPNLRKAPVPYNFDQK